MKKTSKLVRESEAETGSLRNLRVRLLFFQVLVSIIVAVHGVSTVSQILILLEIAQ